MTLNVKIIQKVTGNYTAIYNGHTVTEIHKPKPEPKAKRARTQIPRKGSKEATPAQVEEICETLRAACAIAGGSVGLPVKLTEVVKENPDRIIICKPTSIKATKLADKENKEETPEYVYNFHNFVHSKPDGFELKNTIDTIWNTIPYHRPIEGASVTAGEKQKVILHFQQDIFNLEKNLAEKFGKFSKKFSGYVMTWKQFAEFSYKRVNT
jgi:hypothetical protein